MKVYNLCKPIIKSDMKLSELGEAVYTVSPDKANKLYKLFYGINMPKNYDISMYSQDIFTAITLNNFHQFYALVSEDSHE